jgi:formylglycine-generating enzyme required for sulfatase activity
MKKWALLAILFVLQGSNSFANNILVNNISLVKRNATSDIVFVKFDLSWQNSFKTGSGAANYDAAWVFVKYRIGDTGEWKHATLNNGAHTIPSGTATTQSDGTGLFLYRNNDGNGTFSMTDIELRWNYGADGVADESKIFVKVFAIEMVYIPEGSFQLGSTGQNIGEFRQANDISSTGSSASFTITNSAPTLQGNNASSSADNLSARDGVEFDQGTTTNTATLANGFPTGHGAMYAMKYEISQGQYRDFLNTLTYDQQATRTANAPSSSPGTGALVAAGTDRNGIIITSSGNASAVPAIYGCDLNNNSTPNETDDGEWIACNYLSWQDVAAYLDWAGLRPMTELEYEKICRGSITPIENECAWGDATAVAMSSVTNARESGEASGTTGANVVGDNGYSSGPARVGIFATGTSNRNESGSSYYGVMDLSGNLWEQAITIGNSTGRAFTGNKGNGALDTNGDANEGGWPDQTGAGRRGGSWSAANSDLRVSSRSLAGTGISTRSSEVGGRGCR